MSLADEFLSKLKARGLDEGAYQAVEEGFAQHRQQMSVYEEELRSQNEELKRSKDEIALMSRKYHALFWQLPMGCLVISEQGRVLEVNQEVFDLLDTVPPRISQESIFSILPKILHSPFYQHFQKARSGQPTYFECALNEGSASFRFLEFRLQTLTDAALGDGQNCLLIITDNTQKFLASEAVKQSEARFQEVVDKSPIGVCITNAQGMFDYVNDAYLSIYGYQREEMVGRHFTLVVPGPQQDELTKKHEQFIERKGEISGEFQVQKKNGEPLTIVANAAWFLGHDGQPRKATFVQDLTRHRRLESDNQRFRAALDASMDSVFLIDPYVMRFVDANRQGLAVSGHTLETLRGLGPHDLLEGFSENELRQQFQPMLTGQRTSMVLTGLHRHADGVSFPVECHISMSQSLNRPLLVVVARDISERQKMQKKLLAYQTDLEHMVEDRSRQLMEANEHLQLMARVFENALEAIVITDPQGTIQKVNPAFTRISQYTEAEVQGKRTNVLKSGHHADDFYEAMWRQLLETGQWEGEIWNRRKDGALYPQHLNIAAIYDAQHHPVHFVAVAHDITELKRKEEQIRHSALHDSLTGLPNRRLLLDRLQWLLARSERSGNMLAVVFFDLDDFKKINDSLGHPVGDDLLQQVSQRAQSITRDQDVVARLGGDEFVLLVPDCQKSQDVIHIMERLRQTLKRPYRLQGQSLSISASIGIAVFPSDGREADELMKKADMAMYQAKKSGKNRYHFFTEELEQKAHEQLSIEQAIRAALGTGSFVPFYQPKHCLKTGKLLGFEALVRWRQELGQWVQPAQFLPIAEESGLIAEIDLEMVAQVRRDQQQWHESGLGVMDVAVNLSARDFQKPDFLEQIASMVQLLPHQGFPLQFELTESAVMTEVEATIPWMKQMVDLGVTLAVDDFGTGYSSLYYLKKFPLHTLKVDRGFIRDIVEDSSDRVLVNAIIAMAKNLNLQVVAEGIENHDQMALLIEEGCDVGQGYVFSPPLPFSDVMAYASRKSSPRSVLLRNQEI
jgi:diguanylate cyclase (GGDEF)-like protein/PAS domain S-box-containing protein